MLPLTLTQCAHIYTNAHTRAHTQTHTFSLSRFCRGAREDEDGRLVDAIAQPLSITQRLTAARPATTRGRRQVLAGEAQQTGCVFDHRLAWTCGAGAPAGDAGSCGADEALVASGCCCGHAECDAACTFATQATCVALDAAFNGISGIAGRGYACRNMAEVGIDDVAHQGLVS